MKRHLTQKTYNPEQIILDGNRFLLANGHLGYRGTLEEYGKDQLVGLLIAGVYDQYKDEWRENLALPNPFFFKAYYEGEEVSVLTAKPLDHQVDLDIEKALFARHSEFGPLTIDSERLVSHSDDSLLISKITVKANKAGKFKFVYGLDLDIYEIHGPHFKQKACKNVKNKLVFQGITNENKTVFVQASYQGLSGEFNEKEGLFVSSMTLKENEEISLEIVAKVDEEKLGKLPKSGYAKLKEDSLLAFNKKLEGCKVEIEGDEELDFEIAYSIYHCLILGDEKRIRSIAARGLSGQTYKGAIFWDTEIFLLPFFVLANPKIARNLILYRIATLNGAKEKARSLGYDGAYYAWESQDSGLEACRSDNVTDPITGETVVTYFGTKQIHISADIVYAIDRYIEATGDEKILDEGADDVIFEVAKFFLSYSREDENGISHIDDVIGPDEYHERVNDEAFTLAMAKRVMKILAKRVCPNCLSKEQEKLYYQCLNIKWAEPKKQGNVISEFDGYFDLEDIDVASLKKRVVNPKDYWGGKNGIATHTQVIKQADVISLLALCPEDYETPVQLDNYEYYYPRTEHGSSLSASMHSLVAIKLGKLDEAYKFLRSSSSIDLRGAEKLFAGGVYIGGTHPAANAGAYLGLIYGFLGLRQNKGKINLDIHLPNHIKSVTFRYRNNKQIYEIKALANGQYESKEVKQ